MFALFLQKITITTTTLMTKYREAVRQRKALSRTSSNILLNSVQPYNYQPINNRLKLQAPRFSDCDENNLTIKESQQESHSEVSELEVSL